MRLRREEEQDRTDVALLFSWQGSLSGGDRDWSPLSHYSLTGSGACQVIYLNVLCQIAEHKQQYITIMTNRHFPLKDLAFDGLSEFTKEGMG
jgi:hypothetical protein